MKRTITILMTSALLLSTLLVGGCGKDDAKVSVDGTTEVQTTEEVTTEETITAAVEETTAEPETIFYESLDGESQNDPKYQAGMQKIYDFIEAYDELMAHDKNDIYKMMISALFLDGNNTSNSYYSFLEKSFKDEKIITKDGNNIDLSKTDDNARFGYLSAPLETYFYNYVNNNTGYYDILEWVKNQDSTELIINFQKNNEGLYYLDVPMKGCSIYYGQYFYINRDNINGVGIYYFKDQNEDGYGPFFCETPSIYYIVFEIDEIGFSALFDEDDNLLDITLFGYQMSSPSWVEAYPYMIDPISGISYYDIYTGKAHID